MTDTEFAQKPNKRALRRKLNMSKARRKAFISRSVYGLDWYRHLHQYSKNKVHCSCPMCSGVNKTNTKKLRAKGPNHPNSKQINLSSGFGTTNHRNGKNWSVSDIKKIENMLEDIVS